jgi:hypothetical protein
MAEQTSGGRILLALHLSPELAARLKLASETQQRSATELAVDLLDRYLPRTLASGGKKVNIPYA